jgi:flagellar basal-body rod modification protein FlgD
MAQVVDANGNVVRTIDLGAQKTGIRTFEWDGRTDAGAALPAGPYTMSVTATAKGEAVDVDALTIAKVTGVAPTDTGTVVTLGTIGNVALADILQIH